MFSKLNAQQLAAVKCVDGPVIVFAGAGTGKTRTLTSRIVYMMRDKNIKPYNILAITFTNKATNEMKARLSNEVGIYLKGITICTFHGLCVRILRADIDKLNYKKDFDIIDEDDQLKIISDILKRKGEDRKQAKKIQSAINFAKCFEVKLSNPFEHQIMLEYEDEMQQNNYLDFEDLLLKTKELLASFPEVLKKYQQKFQYILVDEFQDTNLIQYKIVKMLAQEHRNLFVVGDDDQSIYSFRGTNYENMQLFKNDFSEHTMFFLTENYRSNQQILNGANRLIAYNKDREPKELFSADEGEVGDVQVYHAIDEKDEVNYVLDNIMFYKNSHNEFSDFAVLYRTSSLLRNFEIGCIRLGIPYKVFGGVSYLKRREIKDCIAYLKLMLNDDDILSFKRIVNVPGRGIGPGTIEKIEKYRKLHKLTVFQAIDLSKEYLPKAKYGQLVAFKELIVQLRERMEQINLIELFDEMLEIIQYKEFLYNEYEKEEADDRMDNLAEFKSILYQVEAMGIGSRVDNLREAFDNAILSDEYLQSQKENINGVTLSTIHSIKGLEFDYVFVVGLEENLFPNNFKVVSEAEMEEERRIAYVALTRAKKKLFLTAVKRRMLYGSFLSNQPSRFLLEFLGAEALETPKQAIEAEVVSIEEKPLSGYNTGDVVMHDIFGKGIIIGLEDNVGTIFFDKEKSLKKIMLSAPTLHKFK